jgi:arginyl-tRNA synthetase
MDLRKKFAKLIAEQIGSDLKKVFNLIEIPPNSKMGDFAFPCFGLSRTMKMASNKIAEQIVKKIKIGKDFSEIKSVGPYINLFVNNAKLNSNVLREVLEKKSSYGFKKKGKKVVVIEFPSPNTNKPLHLGHLRNMSLGVAMANLLETQGKIVKRVNLTNDRGVHICKSMLAYQRWGKGKKPNKKSDHFVGDYYVMFSQKLKENPKLEEEVQVMLQKWEQKDEKVRALWKKMNGWAFDGLNETYKRFGLKFVKEYYESKTYEKGRKIVTDGLKKGLFHKREDGAVVIDLGGELGEKVLLRPNGTTVYITQDIYLASLKKKDFGFDQSIFVVGNEQNYHFSVLFKILGILGYDTKGLYHLNHGMVNLTTGKIKSREGTKVDGDDIMDQLKLKALKEIKKRGKALEIEKTSELVGLGAVKYFLLKHAAHKDFTFNPEESISFEGNTGPYLQYSLVRAKKILEKTKKSLVNADYKLLDEEVEINLVKQLAKYGEILERATEAHSPHILAEYCFDLAGKFNSFYEACHVALEENKDKQKARLGLVKAYSLVLKSSLNVLGIQEVKAM